MNVVIREKYINGILWVFLGKTSDVMPDYAEKIFFPDYWHPFQGFFPDEQDRLFVLTHEPGANQGEFLFDIFNKEGVFVARRSLNLWSFIACFGNSSLRNRETLSLSPCFIPDF